MTALDHGMILTTLPSEEAAQRMADLLVAERLAACVQSMPVSSTYRWQGAVTRATEILLLIKTRMGLQASIMDRIRAVHPYSVPEIVAVPFSAGLPAYLDWISTETDTVTSPRPPGP